MAIVKYERNKILNSTAQKMKKSFMENFIFCAVTGTVLVFAIMRS